jgi:hypothetical protein
MVGAIASNLHEGSRSEYLAQFIFASFGTVIPVPHQEDTGIDLYCTLTERIGLRSWPRAYFSVQVKSTMEPWVLDGAESVRWLIEYPLPLFLCIVDKRLARIRVYHTSPRFYVWSMPPLPNHLELVPTTDTRGQCTQWMGSNTFSLSAPVLEASLEDLLRDDFYENARNVLRVWIDIDMANLDRLKAGIHSFQLPYEYNTNGEVHGGWVTQGITKAKSLDSALSHTKELADYLASQLHQRGDLAGAARFALLLRHLFKEDIRGASHQLHGVINKLVNGPQTYLFSGVDALNAMIDERLTSGARDEPPTSGAG